MAIAEVELFPDQIAEPAFVRSSEVAELLDEVVHHYREFEQLAEALDEDRTTTRLPLADARHIAGQIYGQLDPSCERLAIAGSIRRQRPDIGDIELVAIPRFIEEPSSLWGDTSQVNLLSQALAREEAEQVLERLSGGERYVKLRHVRSGLQVDLFIVLPPAQWGVILTIRTGPADYSERLVTLARRQGNHVAGGALRSGLRGHSTPAEKLCTCPVIPTPEEADFYAALGLLFAPPERRGET